MFDHLLKHLFPIRPQRPRGPLPERSRYRPLIEALEDRTVPSATATHLEILVPQTATVGTPANITVVALNAANQRVSNFTDTVSISSTDLNTTYTFTTGDHGAHTFSLTPSAAGSETITATDTTTGSTVTAGTVTLNVVAAPVATHFLVLTIDNSGNGGMAGGCGGAYSAGLGLGGSSTVYAGSTVSLEVIALDASNHIVKNYTGTVTISGTINGSTDSTTTAGGSTLPVTETFSASDHGVLVVPLVAGAPGTEVVTVTDQSNSSLTGNTTFAVSAAPVATQIVIQVPRNIVAGEPTPVTVYALDASNHIVKNYAGTVDLSTSDTAATGLPSSYTFTSSDNGKHTFMVTFSTSGSPTITATDANNSSLTDTVTVQVNAPPSHVGHEHYARLGPYHGHF